MASYTSLTFRIAIVINWLLLGILVLSIFGFLSFQNIYGLFLASVTALIAFGVFKRFSWGYFAAAAWGLACFQLAKQGYEFQTLKNIVMSLGFVLIPVAIFLHENLAKKNSAMDQKNPTPSQKNTDSKKR